MPIATKQNLHKVSDLLFRQSSGESSQVMIAANPDCYSDEVYALVPSIDGIEEIARQGGEALVQYPVSKEDKAVVLDLMLTVAQLAYDLELNKNMANHSAGVDFFNKAFGFANVFVLQPFFKAVRDGSNEIFAELKEMSKVIMLTWRDIIFQTQSILVPEELYRAAKQNFDSSIAKVFADIENQEE